MKNKGKILKPILELPKDFLVQGIYILKNKKYVLGENLKSKQIYIFIFRKYYQPPDYIVELPS